MRRSRGLWRRLTGAIIDDLGAYQAAALSVRDNLLVNWNETQLSYTRKNPKRAYYLSLEFLMGRTLDNAVCALYIESRRALYSIDTASSS